MNIISRIIDAISNSYGNEVITTVHVMSMLTVVLALAIFEYVVYRVVSHRTFYNRAFHITIAVLPFLSPQLFCVCNRIL